VGEPDPFDPQLISPFEHNAFLYPQPSWVEVWRRGEVVDTGLRCACGREVVAVEDSVSGWAHVGIGDESDPAGYTEWLEAQ
jgi:hypothetical protein